MPLSGRLVSNMAVMYNIAVPEKVCESGLMGVVCLESLKCRPKYIGGYFATGHLPVLDRIFKERIFDTLLVMFLNQYFFVFTCL